MVIFIALLKTCLKSLMVPYDFLNFMSDTKRIIKELDKIELKIKNEEYNSESRRIRPFGGADVIISKSLTPENERWVNDQSYVISPQKTETRKRLVITPYEKELTWLFHQLADVFHEQIDFVNKYDFYGLLAQNALDFIENNDSEYDCNSLLLSVLNGSKAYVQ